MQQGFDTRSYSPFQVPFEMYFAGMSALAPGLNPLKVGARLQLEAIGFLSRRAQACLEIPSRLSQCRTPQDLIAEQTRFFQTAFTQYAETSRRMTEALSQMVVVPAGRDGEARRTRDYISFSDSSGQSRDRERGRRAA